jgi:hypothetical protein
MKIVHLLLRHRIRRQRLRMVALLPKLMDTLSLMLQPKMMQLVEQPVASIRNQVVDDPACRIAFEFGHHTRQIEAERIACR